MADFYIRSWDPDSTYPANPQEGDVCYTITLDQSWAPVAGVKNDNLVKEEVYQSGEWVEVGGGGGGGDFSIATVTFDVSASDDPINVSFATVITDGEFASVSCFDMLNGDGELFIPLYKGKAFLSVNGEYSFVCSGDVTFDADDSSFVVTGDGSITLS